MKPVIGITTKNEIHEKSHQGMPISWISNYYAKAVEYAGGIPFLIPTIMDKSLIHDMLNRLDGILLTGGVDIHPSYFGEEPINGIGEIDENRDSFEISLVQHILGIKPIFGICRGLQVINVALGGSLYQDVYSDYSLESKNADEEKKLIQHWQLSRFDMVHHCVEYQKPSFLFDALSEQSCLADKQNSHAKKNSIMVNSFHHQSIKKCSEQLKVVAYSSDGLIEAVENLDKKIMAVQWHPELLINSHQEHRMIFEYFIGMCEQK